MASYRECRDRRIGSSSGSHRGSATQCTNDGRGAPRRRLQTPVLRLGVPGKIPIGGKAPKGAHSRGVEPPILLQLVAAVKQNGEVCLKIKVINGLTGKLVCTLPLDEVRDVDGL